MLTAAVFSTLFTSFLTESEKAYQFAAQMEEMGVDVRVTERLGSRVFEEGEWELDYTWFMAEIVAGEPRLQDLSLAEE